ncbi:MAG: hypothetical protein QOK29_219, partial [Rhodospirillaceae bacterium]|nr:hypothetical protein [Rhodospirillaceae bacterium]
IDGVPLRRHPTYHGADLEGEPAGAALTRVLQGDDFFLFGRDVAYGLFDLLLGDHRCPLSVRYR